jgi:hypothetical protein
MVSMMLKQKRPMTVTIMAIWFMGASIPMIVQTLLPLANINVLNPLSPEYDWELNQRVGYLMWLSLPVGGAFLFGSPAVAMAVVAFNYATAILAIRGFHRAYEMIFVVLGIGFVSGFFTFGLFFIGISAIFINIVWIFYLRRDDVKMYFHRMI